MRNLPDWVRGSIRAVSELFFQMAIQPAPMQPAPMQAALKIDKETMQMRTIRRTGPWIAAWMMTVAMTTGGVMVTQGLMAQKQPELRAPTVADARELSNSFREVAHSALPSIVSIETKGKTARVSNRQLPEGLEDSPFGELFKNDPRFKEYLEKEREAPAQRGMGSGFIIDPSGIIMTNNHVVADADQVRVRLSDGREFLASDVKTDPRSDVAIVRIDAGAPLPAIKLGDSDVMDIGDWVLAIGSPFGLDLTVTAGIVSAKGRGPGIAEREDFIQTDAAINPGNSGGPLLNMSGEVIGINTAISSRSGGYEGIGFAIPINMAAWIGQQLQTTGMVERGFLGVGIQPIKHDLAKQFNVGVGQGAIVSQVMPDSPAAAAKLEPGDVVLKLDGKPVSDPRSLQGIVERLKIGGTYVMDVLRNGEPLKLEIAVQAMPKAYNLVGNSTKSEDEAKPEPKKEEFENLGLEVQELKADVAKELGYPEKVQGVLVTAVKPETPAALAGVQVGMVIERVGQKAVSNPEQFGEAMKGLSVDEGILLLLRSPRGTQFVVVRTDR